MKVLVIGSGGREHALAWSVAQSREVSEVLVTPGNPGTSSEQKVRNITLNISDHAAIEEVVKTESIDLTIIGPEQPIVEGLGDFLTEQGHKCLAPTTFAAQLEGSKSFAKEFMKRHKIPTANAFVTRNIDEACAHIRRSDFPIVIKADGLAAGKGVVVATSLNQALNAVRNMLSGRAFGDAASTIVIEDYLDGEEASFIVLTDGEHTLPFATSQDHKPVYDGDKGPNTGGMGAYSPAPVIDDSVYSKIMERIVSPTIQGMQEENNPCQGFLYVGLMICNGDPYVVEYNCRFGDPEAQPVLMRLQSDFAMRCLAATDAGGLKGQQLKFKKNCTVAIVLASPGYPGKYKTNLPIKGLNANVPGTKVFHAGTKEDQGRIVTNGGRVLTVVSSGPTVELAQRNAYARAKKIQWSGVHMRTDIGHRAIAREREKTT
ncbi:MAG: phosphoribosylamine--glycine ligase [Gammaproteobacteria bacterium]|nr:phosphoribosylamine--glycine ligase [Gammaproteobacteria bacterium]